MNNYIDMAIQTFYLNVNIQKATLLYEYSLDTTRTGSPERIHDT